MEKVTQVRESVPGSRQTTATHVSNAVTERNREGKHREREREGRKTEMGLVDTILLSWSAESFDSSEEPLVEACAIMLSEQEKKDE